MGANGNRVVGSSANRRDVSELRGDPEAGEPPTISVNQLPVVERREPPAHPGTEHPGAIPSLMDCPLDSYDLRPLFGSPNSRILKHVSMRSEDRGLKSGQGQRARLDNAGMSSSCSDHRDNVHRNTPATTAVLPQSDGLLPLVMNPCDAAKVARADGGALVHPVTVLKSRATRSNETSRYLMSSSASSRQERGQDAGQEDAVEDARPADRDDDGVARRGVAAGLSQVLHVSGAVPQQLAT